MVLGELVVIFVKGKNLPNRRTLGKQDPYCVGRIGPEAHKTNVDRRGGQTPKWDHEARYTIQTGPEYKALKLSIFHDDSSKPSLIGDTVINLEEAFNIKPPNGYDQWHPLQYMGKYAGEVFLEITFYHSKKSNTRNTVNPKRDYEGASEYSSVSAPPPLPVPPPSIQPIRPLPPYPVSEQELLACRPVPSVSQSTSSVPTKSYGHTQVIPQPGGSPYPDDSDFFRPASINLPPAGTLPHVDAANAHMWKSRTESVQSSASPHITQAPFNGPAAVLPPQNMSGQPQNSLENLVNALPVLGPSPNRPTSTKRRSDPQMIAMNSPSSSFPASVIPPEPVEYIDTPPPVPHHVEQPIRMAHTTNNGVSATYSLVQDMEAMNIRPPQGVAGPSHRVAGPRPNSIDDSRHYKVKRKPVGGGGMYAEAPDGVKSNVMNGSPQIPFSPDSFGEERNQRSSRSRKSDSHLDRAKFAPEPSDLPPQRRILPEMPSDLIEPGISGYAGNGRWSADQYERDRYSQWRNGHQIPKPAVPPKIPFGMSWQEYVEADYNGNQQDGYRI